MKKSNITISKVKLTNFNHSEQPENQMCGVELGLSEELINSDGKLEFVKEHPTVKLRHFLAHEDLCLLFDQVRPHMTLICEYLKPTGDSSFDDIVDSLKLREASLSVFVTQVTLTGDSESAGVVITGYKLLTSGTKLALVTPNIIFESVSYMYARELSDLTDEIMAEALRCITERRRKVIQTEMFEDEGEEELDFEIVGESNNDSLKLKDVTIKRQLAI